MTISKTQIQVNIDELEILLRQLDATISQRRFPADRQRIQRRRDALGWALGVVRVVHIGEQGGRHIQVTVADGGDSGDSVA